MSQNLIILPLLVPLIAGVVTLIFTARARLQRAIGLTAMAANVVVALWGLFSVYRGPFDARTLAMTVGDWPAPFGISLVLDPLSALMITTSAVVAGAVLVYSISQLPSYQRSGFFHPLFHFLILGVQWSFLTGDLFNLFVAFEIMLMSSYAMLIIGTSRAQMRQAYKYVLLNLLASMLFVTCAGLVYGETGTLNLADLAQLNRSGAMPTDAVAIFAVLLLVFGVKTAIFPLWFWLPDAYPTAHPAIAGLFAGLLTKVGAYVMVRIFGMTVGDPAGGIAQTLAPLILIAAGATMFLGVLGAVASSSVRRILSIHIISQVGYMILGVGLGIAAGASVEQRELAVAGAIFFIIHNMVVKTSLFLCGGMMAQHSGGDDRLERMGGLLGRAPWLATLFFVAALSLAGLPPLSGFFGKWLLIRQSFAGGYYTLAGLAIATSLLTLLSMLKIWSSCFWSLPPAPQPSADGSEVGPDEVERLSRRNGSGRAYAMGATALLVVVAISMGLGAQFYFDVSRAAARSIVDPSAYINAVFPHARAPSGGIVSASADAPVEEAAQ